MLMQTHNLLQLLLKVALLCFINFNGLDGRDLLQGFGLV